MEAIAQHADSTKPTLYAHFGSKDRLFQNCQQREADRLAQWLFTTYDESADLSMREQVHAGMRAFFDYAGTHPDGFGLLFNDHTTAGATSVRDEFLRTITERIAEQVRAVGHRHQETRPTISAELLAAMLVGIAVHGTRQALDTDPAILGRAGDLATALAATGIRHLDEQLMPLIDTISNG